MKVIFHVDELGKWELTLKNVVNFFKAEPDADVQVLANVEAVSYYAEEGNVEELKNSGAKFYACWNALKAHEIEEDSLPEFIEIVAAGVVELVKKQNEGYAYIRS